MSKERIIRVEFTKDEVAHITMAMDAFNKYGKQTKNDEMTRMSQDIIVKLVIASLNATEVEEVEEDGDAGKD